MSLSKETKERIAKEAKDKFPSNEKTSKDLMTRVWAEQRGYIAGAEAEATRAAEIIEAYRELHSISNGQLNEMEKNVKDYEPDCEKVARAYELLKIIEALTNYNNPK